ncbi:hypothetical protein ACFL2V_11885 [Pseudomonadota bacterium]
MNNKRAFLSAIIVLFSMGISQFAYAHKVNLFAYAEEGEVFVEGYFVDGKKAQNSTVQVFNASGELVVEGTTDDEGIYRFSTPGKSDLKITLNAGMGHKGEFSLSADELGGEPVAADGKQTHVPTDKPATETSSHDSVGGGEGNAGADHHASSVPAQAVAAADIEKIVRKAVNEAVKPLVRELDESQQKASLSGIVGGVGYIIGFLGIFAYMTARKEAAKK